MEIIKNEKTEKNTTELTITVSKEEFAAATERSYRKNSKKMNIPGFRQGKAPRKIAEQLYGEAVFFDDAVNETYPKAYSEAVAQTKVEPVDYPKIEITEISPEGYTFVAKITTKPEVEIGTYKGLTAEKASVEVTDEEVEHELSHMVERASHLVEVDRPAELFDTVCLDFEGFVNGEAFPGGKGEKFDLNLGSKQFIPGFEEQLVGAKAGDSVDVNVTFPEEYHAPELAGQNAVFKCLIHSVSEKVKPEMDDEFAKDVSEFSTLKELKDDIRAKIAEHKQKDADSAFEELLIDQLINNMKADIPQVMFDNQTDSIVDEFAQRISAQGMDFNSYMKMNGMDVSSFRKLFAEQAARRVKSRLALEAVAKAEGISVSDEELENEYKKMAEQYKMNIDKLKMYVSADELRSNLELDRAMKVVADSAKAVPMAKKAEEDAPKAAKKSTRASKAAKDDADAEKPKKTTRKKTAKAETDGAAE